MGYSLEVNGKSVDVDVPADTPLLAVLRDTLDLTGTRYGCGQGDCGACYVLLDGRAVASCNSNIAQRGPSVRSQIGRYANISEAEPAAPVADAESDAVVDAAEPAATSSEECLRELEPLERRFAHAGRCVRVED